MSEREPPRAGLPMAIEIPVGGAHGIDPARVKGLQLSAALAVDIGFDGHPEISRATIRGRAASVELRRGAPEPVVEFLESLVEAAAVFKRGENPTAAHLAVCDLVGTIGAKARAALEHLGHDRLRFEGVFEYVPERKIVLGRG